MAFVSAPSDPRRVVIVWSPFLHGSPRFRFAWSSRSSVNPLPKPRHWLVEKQRFIKAIFPATRPCLAWSSLWPRVCFCGHGDRGDRAWLPHQGATGTSLAAESRVSPCSWGQASLALPAWSPPPFPCAGFVPPAFDSRVSSIFFCLFLHLFHLVSGFVFSCSFFFYRHSHPCVDL